MTGAQMDISVNSVADLAALATAFIALIGLVFAIVQIRSNQASQREATAKEIWMSYELRAFDYPRFNNPQAAAVDHEAQTFDGDFDKYMQYESFVSFVLLACDEALRLGGKDWENAVDDNLMLHWDYLGSPRFAPYMKNMSPLMRRRLDTLTRKQAKIVREA